MIYKKNYFIIIEEKIIKKVFIQVEILLYFLGIFNILPKEKIKKHNYYKYKVEAKKLHETGEKLKEIEAYKKCINENGKNLNAYFNLIDSYIEINDFQNAKEYSSKIKNKISSINEKKKYDLLIERLEKSEKRVKNHKDLTIVKDIMNRLYTNGAKIKKTKIDYNKNNIRGLIATEDIVKDETIVEIPLNILITKEQAKNFLIEKYSKETKLSKEEISEILKKCIAETKFELVLFILENYEKETYKEYCSIIESTDVSNFPYFMDEKTKEEFQNTDIIELLESKNEIIDHDINLLYDNIEPTKKFDYNLLKKFYIIVSSRTFGVKINNKETTILSPYIDMANHNNEKKNTYWTFDNKKNSFILEATKDIKKSSEIYDTYGKKSNKYLYILYGFTERDNKIKEINLLYNDKQYRCFENFNENKNELKNLLRDIEEDIINENIAKSSNKKKTKKIDKKNIEIKKFEKLKSLCLSRLIKYKTTLKDDKNNINKNNSIAKYNCLNILIEEKTVLDKLITFSNECINFFKKYKINEIKKYEKQINSMSQLTIDYLKTLE